ncbi:GntR family transcriptional regulator [Bacillus sonorensis]|nr:GntR family transcriptional regulator [Bacillus sonorensis]
MSYRLLFGLLSPLTVKMKEVFIVTFSIQRPVSYHDQVHRYLKDMIIKGRYQPGERIYESKIAKELQVSRSPVREAIRTLEQEGLLLIDEKSKITVYEPTLKDLEDIYQCLSKRLNLLPCLWQPSLPKRKRSSS